MKPFCALVEENAHMNKPILLQSDNINVLVNQHNLWVKIVSGKLLRTKS